jgi:RNA polymerase sigma-70 factor (ECF subfamily)
MSRERNLVLRAQSGDSAACDELLREIERPLHRFIAGIVPEHAQDVLQDVFITIVRKIAWLNDASLFRPWAYRIASRAAFRLLKKQRGRAEEPLVETAAEIATEVGEPDPWQRERLLANVARLSPASRAVVTLHYLDELPLADVAAVLDISLGTVKSRLAYGLAQLRKETQ